jgi:hypothetical protein
MVSKTLNTLSICLAATLVAACGGGGGDPGSSQAASEQIAREAMDPAQTAAASDKATAKVSGQGRDLEPDEGLRR